MNPWTTLTTLALLLLAAEGSFAQQMVRLEGYVFEENNRGYLNEVKITVYDADNAIKAESVTNTEGFFSTAVPIGGEYKVKAEKGLFYPTYEAASSIGADPSKTIFVAIEMKRQPGYLFDVTIAETVMSDDVEGKEAVMGVKLEIFNNTLNTEELIIDSLSSYNFQFTFEQGHHYTILLRKYGYFNKRIEAHVNIDGCILCVEGMGELRPSDNLTKDNTMGTLLANIEMQRIDLNRAIKVENIYYDYNKWDIRPDAALELDKVIKMMKENPSIVLELGSHTDARGRDSYNEELSQKRAQSAVDYIIKQGKIVPERIIAKGYGESQVLNRCKNGVDCSDEEHEYNRRTELKVIGYVDDPHTQMSLRDIIYEENMEAFLREIGSGEDYIEVPADMPPSQAPLIQEESAPAKPERLPEVSLPGEGLIMEEESTPMMPGLADEAAPPQPLKSHVKPLSSAYTGVLIELHTTDSELQKDDPLFAQYGGLLLEKRKNGQFAYLLDGFKTVKDAQKFLDSVIKARYPKASVVEYRNGQRQSY